MTNLLLAGLAEKDKMLKPHFAGFFAAHQLPATSIKGHPPTCIVKRDKAGQEGMHWIALWTKRNVCEKMNSYGLPLALQLSGSKHCEMD